MDRIPIETLLFRPRHRGWTVAAFGAIVAVGLVDFITGPQITFSVFYLVPVAAAAWISGIAAAGAASLLAAAVWFVAEIASSRVDPEVFVYAWNFCTRLLFLLLVALLLARLREMFTRERDLSRTDSLTGLPNSRAFREIAEIEIARARRYAQPLSLAFIDIDDFKGVNDSRGHSAGDRLLKCIAELLRGNLRSSDFVARYGGDEFVVLLPVADQEAARAAMDMVGDRLSRAMSDGTWPVTLSAGVVTYTPGGPPATVDTMLETADRLMYEVKTAGKQGVRYATHTG